MSRLAAKKKKPSADATDVTPFRLDNHVFYLFGQIFGHRNRLLNRELRQFSIDYPRWRVLGALNEHPGCSMQKLADKTAVDRTTLAHTVRIMVDEKLVHRHARASDRRSVVLALTPRGSHLLKQILPTVLDINDRCLAGFSKGDVENLLARLRQMIDNIKE